MSQSFIDLVKRGATKEIAAWVEDTPEIALSRDAGGVSALMWSIYSGQAVVRDFLLSGITDLDVWEAAATGNSERLSSLLSLDPGLLATLSPDGWTPLHLAAAFGTPDAVRLLLADGADVHRRGENPLANQPLHAALALSRDPAIVELLLAHGADPNATQHGGFTPLHQAAAAGRADLIALLLRAGASAGTPCDKGKTPADYARERGHAEAAGMLEAATATPPRL